MLSTLTRKIVWGILAIVVAAIMYCSYYVYQYQLGKYLYRQFLETTTYTQEEIDQALDQVVNSANLGYPPALLELANIYSGEVWKYREHRNIKLAVQYYQAAIAAETIFAMEDYAIFLINTSELGAELKGIDYLQKAYQKGFRDPSSAVLLLRLLIDGTYIQEDYNAAGELINQLQMQSYNDRETDFLLQQYYMATSQDLNLMNNIIQSWQSQDNELSHYLLAKAYLYGNDVVQRDLVKGWEHLQKIDSISSMNTLYELANSYQHGWGTTKNNYKAYVYYREVLSRLGNQTNLAQKVHKILSDESQPVWALVLYWIDEYPQMTAEQQVKTIDRLLTVENVPDAQRWLIDHYQETLDESLYQKIDILAESGQKDMQLVRAAIRFKQGYIDESIDTWYQLAAEKHTGALSLLLDLVLDHSRGNRVQYSQEYRYQRLNEITVQMIDQWIKDYIQELDIVGDYAYQKIANLYMKMGNHQTAQFWFNKIQHPEKITFLKYDIDKNNSALTEIAQLESQVVNGDAEIQYKLADYYLFGQLDYNQDKAIQLLRESADQGHLKSSKILVDYYAQKTDGPSYKLMMHYAKIVDDLEITPKIELSEHSKKLQKLVKQGRIDAKYVLSYRYLSGNDAPKDIVIGQKLLIESAEEGWLEAQHSLIYNYLWAENSFTHDWDQSIYWAGRYENNGGSKQRISSLLTQYNDVVLPARKGDVLAQLNLGQYYYKRIHNNSDPHPNLLDAAEYWLKQAAEKNNVEAVGELLDFYHHQSTNWQGGKIAYEKALQLAMKYEDQSVKAQIFLAKHYQIYPEQLSMADRRTKIHQLYLTAVKKDPSILPDFIVFLREKASIFPSLDNSSIAHIIEENMPDEYYLQIRLYETLSDLYKDTEYEKSLQYLIKAYDISSLERDGKGAQRIAINIADAILKTEVNNGKPNQNEALKWYGRAFDELMWFNYHHISTLNSSDVDDKGRFAYSVAKGLMTGLYNDEIIMMKDKELSIQWYEKAVFYQNKDAMIALFKLYKDQNPEKAYFYGALGELDNNYEYDDAFLTMMKGLSSREKEKVERSIMEYKMQQKYDVHIPYIERYLAIAEQESSGTMYTTLAEAYIYDEIVQPDYEKVKIYVKKSAELGYVRAYSWIAATFLENSPDEENVNKSLEFLALGVAAGDSYSGEKLGDIYFYGQHQQSQDYGKARRAYESIKIEDGQRFAWPLYRLGMIYYEGLDGQKDIQKAHKYFLIASENGQMEAKAILETMMLID